MANSLLHWQGPQVLEQIASQLIARLDRADLLIEAKAKTELYPGHGKITGILQRSILRIPARRQDMRIVGGVKTAGVPYAALIHRRYRYLEQGFLKARPNFVGIFRS
mgnify:CR=1 FL=1|jgi:glyoxylase-like metal-dependent hydrolase (beta-lactamase superfamily II)